MKIFAIISIASVSFIVFSNFATAATTLARGQLAFVGYNSDNPDQIAFTTTVDMDSTTEIIFTDNGWFAAGGFRSGEGTSTWMSGSNISAGTIVTLDITNDTANVGTLSGGVALSADGDQIFAYQGTTPTSGADSNFIAGLQMNNGSWDITSSSPNTSAQPFTDFFSLALNLEVDNAAYTGPRNFSSESAFQSAVLDTSNWTTDNANPLAFSTTPFTIPEPSSIFLIGVSVSALAFRRSRS